MNETEKIIKELEEKRKKKNCVIISGDTCKTIINLLKSIK